MTKQNHTQGGNFLLQALLALALIVAFMPIFTGRLLSRDRDAQMYAVSSQIETAQTASRIYLRENLNTLPYNTIRISGDRFADTLESYGLPLGFLPRTTFDQNITLVINKTIDDIQAYLELSGGNLNEIARAELVKRIGFYASMDDKNIYVIVPLDEVFSQIVRRRDKNVNDNGFLTDLDMGQFGLENGGAIMARNGEFETIQATALSLFGIEDGRKIRSKIDNLVANKSVFQSGSGEAALTITRGVLNVGNLSLRTISKYGDTGNFVGTDASVFDLSMTAGRAGFTGPAKWEVRGNVITDNITFSTERLEISSFINASRGQDVYINTDDLDYSTRSGMEVGIMRAANITMRDQTSTAIIAGQTGAVILDIRPASTSVLPDVLLSSINNDTISILAKPSDSGGDTVDCKSIITSLNGKYSASSLSQHIICQYVFWQRLEKRIDIKRCMLDGGNDC
ncbi:hypothetical protein LJC18_02020 [Lachnospiraceae bacterium OttesenSCG-928-E19]|nr:hypothetical protein [Lachnospiraceae bacterium OttesenSCG-928-E19]